MKARISSGIAGALIALTVSLVAFAGVPMATAGSTGSDGDLVLGSFISNGGCTPGTTNCTNFVTGVTSSQGGLTFRADGGTGLSGVSLSGDPGVSGHSQGVGGTGVSGVGDAYGVEGQGGSYGLYGHDSEVGVYAQGTSEGVHGFSGSGIGVAALSSSGTALSVSGKAKFSRSGITPIAAGASSKTISLGGVTTSSMVLATAQQARAVHVKAAVPGTGSFTIRLTGTAPTGGLKVAYFVLN